MTELADKSCIPSDGNTPPVLGERATQLLSELGDGWAPWGFAGGCPLAAAAIAAKGGSRD